MILGSIIFSPQSHQIFAWLKMSGLFMSCAGVFEFNRDMASVRDDQSAGARSVEVG